MRLSLPISDKEREEMVFIKYIQERMSREGFICTDWHKKLVNFLCGQCKKGNTYLEPQHDMLESGQDTRQTCHHIKDDCHA
jgi:hypothetical protein